MEQTKFKDLLAKADKSFDLPVQVWAYLLDMDPNKSYSYSTKEFQILIDSVQKIKLQSQSQATMTIHQRLAIMAEAIWKSDPSNLGWEAMGFDINFEKASWYVTNVWGGVEEIPQTLYNDHGDLVKRVFETIQKAWMSLPEYQEQ